MTSSKSTEKLAEVLQLFLLPGYNVVSPTYLDLLLTHVTKRSEDAKADSERLEVLRKWVQEALEAWTNIGGPCQAVSMFTVKLVGIIARDESHFKEWNSQKIFDRLCAVLRLREQPLSASVKMAYTCMLSDVITHHSGRQWVIESGTWRDVVKFCQANQTMYVTRESQKFLWSLLLSECRNEKFCREVILEVTSPIISNQFDTEVHEGLQENYLDRNTLLCATIDLLTNILENTLFVDLDSPIPALLEELTNLEVRVKALFEACINTRFLQRVHKLVLLLLFLRLKQGILRETKTVDEVAWSKFLRGLTYVYMMLIPKKHVIELVKTAKLALIYWKKTKLLCDFTPPGQYKFEHQAIALMVLPLCVCIKKTCLGYDLFEMFLNKIFEVTCPATLRLAYTIRDVIMKGDLPLEHICKVSIGMLLEIMDIMDRDVAVITFQTFCHVLKNFAQETTATPPPDNVVTEPRRTVYKSILEGDPIVENTVLLSALLDGLAAMTEKFKLKWQECVETICVLAIGQEILNHSGTLPKLCVQALKICKLAIQNFMPPNLALLVDSESHMDGIGSTLFKRLHDTNWEVRDSVLEVLNTIATISEDKYPAFQDFLLVNRFLQLAIEVATNDTESYVRASALTFISTTVRINKLWDAELCQLDLLGTAAQLLENESEAVVRREAVILIKELYVYRKWPKSKIEVMSHMMATSAVLDLHWEVKTNALEFWKHFIKSHLTDQGMLDGSFPNVTFSKEHRKIVTLNETEIKRRLNKALDELAKQRCLGVLLATLEDDCDFEVSRISASIVNKLKWFLLKYKINEPLPTLPLPKDSATMDTPYIKQTTNITSQGYLHPPEHSYSVINEIVDATDANLLASMYKTSMKMDSPVDKSDQETLRLVSEVTREKFLRATLDADIDAYIQERSRWLKTYTDSFDSILDDIVTTYQNKGVNTMDCY
ncbi:uncharacterized protein LOC105701446 [Orussus abietinus]|uniref:uncharacterized protein LOC105701446 n=1 Tax=Orussus abietinus TaxID=222816 RepID=UPI000625E735|nr:uncharacterized protein LOC105701446 [Orussus abietinus]